MATLNPAGTPFPTGARSPIFMGPGGAGSFRIPGMPTPGAGIGDTEYRRYRVYHTKEMAEKDAKTLKAKGMQTRVQTVGRQDGTRKQYLLWVRPSKAWIVVYRYLRAKRPYTNQLRVTGPTRSEARKEFYAKTKAENPRIMGIYPV